MGEQTFHIAMFPWFAFGHLKVYLHLSNKLAQNGHKISLIAPPKTLQKLHPFNFHPDLISFVPIAIPDVNGISPGPKTSSDIRLSLGTLLATALNQTEEKIENLLRDLNADVVFFDFAHWIPKLARKIGIKSIYYNVIGPATVGYTMSPERSLLGREVNETDLMKPPRCFPDQTIHLRPFKARAIAARMNMEFGDKISFYERQVIGLTQSDMIAFKACREIEGAYCDYIEAQFEKPVLLTGPFIPDPPTSPLEEKWDSWLNKFKASSVVYCAFGTECFLTKDQFQELVLGLELTGLPFLATLKPPAGCESVEAALPENFERTKERGIVHSGWVQQQLVLEHPSVGCFITHCGSNSLSEALLSKCRLVLLPNVGDQVINARIMGERLKVGVEVQKRDEDGFFTREGVSEAVRLGMDEDSAVRKEVISNHSRIRKIFLDKDLESSYIESFDKKLVELIGLP